MIRLVAVLVALASPAASQSFCLCLKCATGLFRSYVAPAGSMKPTILTGQCFIARLDFETADLTQGTIVTFRHPTDGNEWVKRIVATERQTVQMIDGRLVIDGRPVRVEEDGIFVETFEPQGPAGKWPRCANGVVPEGPDCIKTRAMETLGDVSYGILDVGSFPLDNTGIFTVPEGHLFLLGDNRDNSDDSRLRRIAGGLGFIPVANVTGIVDEIR